MAYTLHPATLNDALTLNAGLTKADRDELRAGEHEPLESIIWGIKHSLRPLAIFDKDRHLAAIAGVVPQDRFFLVGAPWMLTTRFTRTEPVAFVKQSQEWVDGQLSHYKVLQNTVWRNNSDHIRLLRHLGFSVLWHPTNEFFEFFQESRHAV